MADRKSSTEAARREALRKTNEAASLLHRGKGEKAARLLEEAAELLPDHPGILMNLGGAYVLLGRFTEAESVLTRASELAPDDAMVWSNLGAALLRVPALSNDERQRRAIAAYREALEIDPRAPSVAYHLGLVHRLRQEWSEAARYFQLALDAHPADRDARSLRDQMRQKAAEGDGGIGDSPAPADEGSEPR